MVEIPNIRIDINRWIEIAQEVLFDWVISMPYKIWRKVPLPLKYLIFAIAIGLIALIAIWLYKNKDSWMHVYAN